MPDRLKSVAADAAAMTTAAQLQAIFTYQKTIDLSAALCVPAGNRGVWFYLSTILDDYTREIIAGKQCTTTTTGKGQTKRNQTKALAIPQSRCLIL